MKRIAVFFLLFLLCCHHAQADDYAILIEPSKKILFPDRLGLPPETTVESLLRTMPELMRRGDILFDNYDIQYDGKSVGESRDVIVLETKVSDLEKIEVTTSSVQTQSRSGQSGTINLIPKKLEEGLEGKVMLGAETTPDIMPAVNLNYMKNKLEMRGHANFEYYNPATTKVYTDVSPGKTIFAQEGSVEKYIQQTARVDMKYGFDDKNTVKAWLLETYGDDFKTVFNDKTISTDGSQIHGVGWQFVENKLDTIVNADKSLMLSAKMEYEHKFAEDSKFIVYAGYEGTNKQDDQEVTFPRIFDGEIKYEGVVMENGDSQLKIKPGVNVSYNDVKIYDDKYRNLYISPYFDFDYKYRNLWVNATARYQMNSRYNELELDKIFEETENEFVGNLNVTWNMTPNDAVRFTASRNIIRPTDIMMYPGFVYYPSLGKWVFGNPELVPTSVYDFELGYIMNRDWGQRSLILNANVGYDRAVDVIEERLDSDHSRPLGADVFSTYTNTGVNDIAKVNFSAIYKYDILTLSAAGNTFLKFISGEKGKDMNIYYNVSVSAILNFINGWSLSTDIQYNSPMATFSCLYGDRLLASAKIFKNFGRLTVGLGIFDIFDYFSTDVTEDQESKVSSIYDLYGRTVSCLISYKLGRRK